MSSLAVVEPVHSVDRYQRRLLPVIGGQDGRVTLDADVRGIVLVDDNHELRGLAEDLLRAVDGRQ